MRLKKVSLQNIRSYTEGEVEFPEGSTLLSGNIGSGKTTILLAIEFALFGIMKGNLSGAGLLRNGADTGSVEVSFSLDDQDVRICRNLKRTSSSVVQDAGFIEINGIRKDATATEIKQRVLELLNYPKDLLTKNKALLYRYTVYTPQEEMKYILQCEQEERLEVLRKVFGIDKYKRIAGNAKILVQYMKDKKKEIMALVVDLPALQEQLSERQVSAQALHTGIDEARKAYEDTKRKAETAMLEVDMLEKSLLSIKEAKKNLEMATMMLNNNHRRSAQLAQEQETFGKAIASLKDETSGFTEISLKEAIQEEKEKLAALERELQAILLQMHGHKLKKEAAEHLIHKISALNNCPMCLQDVREEHKHTILSAEKEKVAQAELEKERITGLQSSFEGQITEIRKKIEQLLAEENQNELKRLKIRNLKEKEFALLAMQKEHESIAKEISELGARQKTFQEMVKDTSLQEEIYALKKAAYRDTQMQEKNTYLKKAECEIKIKSMGQEILLLQKKIEEKEGIRKKLENLQKLQYWLEEHFMQMMQNMETSIMLKVHQDFNALFEKWFSMLVEKDVLSIKLDEAFTPKIEQNGYDIDFEFLSGGEKTAAALAYRLALNQVINNLMGVVATKDLIILDEPTDGFSSEQLDRLRNVLEELHIKQIVIVSHEPKIESFVQKVIKFDKKEHMSIILG